MCPYGSVCWTDGLFSHLDKVPRQTGIHGHVVSDDADDIQLCPALMSGDLSVTKKKRKKEKKISRVHGTRTKVSRLKMWGVTRTVKVYIKFHSSRPFYNEAS